LEAPQEPQTWWANLDSNQGPQSYQDASNTHCTLSFSVSVLPSVKLILQHFQPIGNTYTIAAMGVKELRVFKAANAEK